MTTRFSKLLSLLAGVCVATTAHAQMAQNPVSSHDTTITYGQSFTPAYSGGSGTGNWEFCIGGYTGFSGQRGMPTGTDLGGGNYSPSWTPPAAGSYGFYILKCADANYSVSMAGWYTLTVSKAPMAAPTFTAGSYTINVNQSWGGPGMTAPASNGSGQLMYCVSGVTNWQAGSWTPTGTGNFQLFVAQKADSNHNGNVTDPIQGPMQVNYTPVTLSVVKQNQSGVSISAGATTVQAGSSVSFTASGGNGGGGWVWNGANGSGSSASATFNTAGTYTVSVYKQGDSSYNDSSPASVNIVVKVVSFSWAYSPSSPYAYQTYNVSVGVNSGGFPNVTLYKNGGYMASGWYGTQANTSDPAGWVNYSATYYDSMYNFSGSGSSSVYVSSVTSTSFNFSGGPNFIWDTGTKSVSVSPVPSNATYSTSGTYSASEPGNYTAYASATGAYSGSGSYNWSIAKANQSTVTISPTSATVTAGQTLNFVAGGGNAGAYVWGGDGSAISGSSGNVTFNTTGTRTVTVYRAADTHYNQSNTATATITVNAAPVLPPVVTSGNGTATTSTPFSYQISATNSPTSWTASPLPGGLTLSGNTISGSPTIAGNFTINLSATNGGGTGTGTLSLAIDFSAGDLTTTTYQYDKTNQLKHDGGGQYTPDAEGNIQSTGP